MNKTDIKNSLSGSGRMLVVITATVAVALIIGIYTIKSFTTDENTAKARINAAPETTSLPTGEDADEQYQAKIEQLNREAQSRAAETGSSFFPTLMGASTEICDDECASERARLEGELQEASNRERQLRREMEDLRRAQAEAAANQVPFNRHYYEIDGVVYMSPEYQEAEITRMRSEMQRIAQVHRPKGANFSETEYNRTRATTGNNQPGSSNLALTSAVGGNGLAVSGQNTLLDAGSIEYAILDLEANSDVPGPLRATIHGGVFDKAKLLGGFKVSNDYLVIEFNSLISATGDHYPVKAIAIDYDRRLAGMADRVDKHYLQRFGALFGAAFLQGYGEAVIASRQITRTTANSEEVVSGIESNSDRALAALGKVGDELAAVVRPYVNRPPTVIKYADTGIGLLFLEPVIGKE